MAPGDVARLAGYGQALDARLGRAVAAEGPARQEAACLLEQFERSGGRAAQEALLTMMGRVAGTAEFDDPVVVAFTEQYGGLYSRAQAVCG